MACACAVSARVWFPGARARGASVSLGEARAQGRRGDLATMHAPRVAVVCGGGGGHAREVDADGPRYVSTVGTGLSSLGGCRGDRAGGASRAWRWAGSVMCGAQVEGPPGESVPPPSWSTGAGQPVSKLSKPRLPPLDSMRFFLIGYICVGHFIQCAGPSALVAGLFGQINVAVGAFFVLSGYVAAYTATELGAFEASARLRPETAYTLGRVAGFYPLHLLVLVLFSPMFIYVDLFYNGGVAALSHGLMSLTLTQAWFPAHAEVWNAPTWFLSALTFAMAVLPYALGPIARLSSRNLKRLLGCLTAVALLAKIAYSYDLGAWALFEGTLRKHPNILLWNVTRFHPFYALVEVLMGAAACRLVMVQGAVHPETGEKEHAVPAASPALPLLAILATFVARAAGLLTLNDGLTRSLIFIPLYLAFLVRVHRQCLEDDKPPFSLTAVLSTPFLVYLGTLSFPIYVLHSPIGQLFYKKAVAKILFGRVMTGIPAFFAWLAVVLVSAALVNKFFVENKAVQQKTKDAVKAASAMLA